MKLNPANQDVSYIGDAYGAAGYVCGYLTKAESGQSALLKKCDEEFSGQPEHIKIKQMAKVLDKSREISIQESVYRILGLPLCKFSVKVREHFFTKCVNNHCFTQPCCQLIMCKSVEKLNFSIKMKGIFLEGPFLGKIFEHVSSKQEGWFVEKGSGCLE